MNLKSKKGITLVALVVTIIVLLILAGVTLKLISGSDGILGKANNAATETKYAAAKEELELYLSEENTEYFNDKYVSETPTTAANLRAYLVDKAGENKKIEIEEGKAELEFINETTGEIKYTSTKGVEIKDLIMAENGTLSGGSYANVGTGSGSSGSSTGSGSTLPTGDGTIARRGDIKTGHYAYDAEGQVIQGELTGGGSSSGGTYQITYYANDGSTADATVTCNVGDTVTIDSTKGTIAGKEFKGWMTRENGSISDVIETYKQEVTDLSLYGLWEWKTYTKESTITYGGYDFYIIGGETSASENLILLKQTTYGSNAHWETAKSNAAAFGTSLGVTGRLMTRDEANSISSGIRGIGSTYWLGTAYTSYTYCVLSDGSVDSRTDGNTSNRGLRPVIEVSKSLLP